MNGHPIARMKLILRQGEAPVKIYNSRWIPASNYSVEWSIVAGQWSNMKNMSKNNVFNNCSFHVYIDPRGPGGHPGGSRTDSGGEKPQNMIYLKNRFCLFVYI